MAATCSRSALASVKTRSNMCWRAHMTSRCRLRGPQKWARPADWIRRGGTRSYRKHRLRSMPVWLDADSCECPVYELVVAVGGVPGEEA